MSLDAAFQEALSPVVERIEDAARLVTEQMEFARRVEASGLPPGKAAFTITELTEILGFDRDILREMYHTGVLEGIHTGSKIRVFRWSVLEYLGLPDPAKKKARR